MGSSCGARKRIVVRSTRTGSPRPVCVSSVLDAEDDDLAIGFVDAVKDAVGAAPSRVDPGQVSAQLLTHTVRVLQECASDELEDGGRHRLGKAGADGADGRWGQN